METAEFYNKNRNPKEFVFLLVKSQVWGDGKREALSVIDDGEEKLPEILQKWFIRTGIMESSIFRAGRRIIR